MRQFLVIAILCTLFMTGCYMPIKGRIIDAETQQPIEGAVVLVEWTKTHGFGDYWHTSYKVVEVLSDKDGKVKIEGCYSPFVNEPDVTVYKAGYVGWSSKTIFPELNGRTDFKWGDYTFKLEKFKSSYSYERHQYFITNSINDSLPSDKKHLFLKAFREGEEKQRLEERAQMRSK